MTDELLKQRLGRVTASSFGKLIKSDRSGGWILSKSETATNLIYKIVWERLLINGRVAEGLGRLDIGSKATEHGNDYEPQAVDRYQHVSGNKVEYYDQFHMVGEYIGGTPDGYVGDDGLIEIKCPWNGGNHLRHRLTGELYNKEHYVQVQGYLMITGRTWCDYVTYDPDMPEGLDIHVTRIERNENMIEAMRGILNDVADIVRSEVEKLET